MKPLCQVISLVLAIGWVTGESWNPNHMLVGPSAALRDEKQTAVFLNAGQTKRFFFSLSDSDRSVTLRVSPCGGMVKWQLSAQLEEDTIEASGDFENGSGDDDETSTSRDSETIIIQESPNTKPEVTLIREVGVNTMNYYGDSLSSGFYHFYITSTDNNSVALVYFAKSSKGGQFIPKLPKRSRVDISNITQTSVVLTWSHSPSVDLFKNRDIEYCAVLSQAKQYHTYCQLEVDQKLSLWTHPKSEPMSNALYGPEDHLHNYEQMAQRSKFGARVQKSGQDPQISCMRYKTTYQFDKLESDKKYHLALFAVNRITGGSTAYEGASFVTLRIKERENDVIPLEDNQMVASYLNPSRDSTKVYEFPVRKFRKRILIAVQPCSGYVRITIAKDGKQMRQFVTEELKVVTVVDVTPGVFKITVANDDPEAKVYKIWASVRPSKNPYPKLPMDTSIKVLDHSRTCNSVVLGWLVTHEKQNYCLYRRREKDDYFKTLILEESDQCQGPPADMERVFCKRLALDKGGTLIMKETVLGLEAGTTYRFDLYAAKPNKQPMSYRTVWVKTLAKC